MAELEQDASFLEQRRHRQDALRLTEEQLRAAEMPLLAVLRSAGVELSSIWDLVNTKTAPPPNTVPILLDHLSRDYPDRVREGIARALAIPQARIGWTQLVDHFQKDSDRSGLGAKFAIASALATIADESVMGDLIRLAVDPRHGQNRIPFVRALARASDPRARKALQQLALDADTSAEVTQAPDYASRSTAGCPTME